MVEVLNHAGEEGGAVLRLLLPLLEPETLALWKGIGDVGTGGNCFFATTHAAIQLIQARLHAPIHVVTGRFDHEDVGPVFHCWLEHRGVEPIVINLSNLKDSPLYTARRSEYFRKNHCRIRFQEIPLRRISIKLSNWHEAEVDIRHFTHRLLAPTLQRSIRASERQDRT